METCQYPVFVNQLQKERQIPAKLTLGKNGSEAVKTINLALRAIKLFNCEIFQSQWDLHVTLYFKKKTNVL